MNFWKAILSEQQKNFSILFRKLSSVLLLILGPLVLILLIGFAYSGEDVHDIKIGVISSDYEMLEPAFANFSSYATVTRYANVSGCVDEIAAQKTHICLEFSPGFIKQGEEELPSGSIRFYFDNSKKALSNKLVESISKFFGGQAEKISIESARTIFSNIQYTVVYLKTKEVDLHLLVNESESIKSDLIERKERLIEIRNQFLPAYLRIKQIQKDANTLAQGYNTSFDSLSQAQAALSSALDDLEKATEFELPEEIPEESNIGFFNISLNTSLNLSFPEDYLAKLAIRTAIIQMRSRLDAFNDTGNSLKKSMGEQLQELDNAVSMLDRVRDLLDSDITASEEYVKKIDSGILNVLAIEAELNQSLKNLERLDPQLAEKLVKPILQDYEPILPGKRSIEFAFPGMLAIIIIFISILFSTIVTLSEVNSKAFYRNLLSPQDNMVFVFGILFTNIIVVLFQISVLLMVGQVSFGIDVLSHIFPVLFIVLLLALFFICLGMLSAILIRNEQTAILSSTFVALGFFMFSDAVAPLETMPPLASAIASWNPFVVASLAFKKILVFSLGATSMAVEAAILVMYLTILVGLLVHFSKKILK
ncbi:MAG: ABC transporter permease [Nanoarchaeota archaeon]|nr:ABC transporter permease [Nanoarchaeota archaeon]